MVNVHESAEAGKDPSCASDAEPAKEIESPTAQRSADVGEVIAGTGALLLAVIVLVVLDDAPRESVTVSRAVYTPGVTYRNELVAAVASVVPSSVKSHAYR